MDLSIKCSNSSNILDYILKNSVILQSVTKGHLLHFHNQSFKSNNHLQKVKTRLSAAPVNEWRIFMHYMQS